MKKIAILCVLFLFITANTVICSDVICSDEKSYVENLIKSKTEQILSVIRKKDISQKEKKQKIFDIAKPLFDFTTISKLTLGKKYWSELTPEQQKRFVDLFIKRLRMVYLDRVNIYGNETVSFKPAIQKRKNIIYVPSVVTSKNEKFAVLYKFWKSPKGWKIYDVEVEGVSIVRTYRSQFTEIIKKKGIKGLFEELEKLTQQS